MGRNKLVLAWLVVAGCGVADDEMQNGSTETLVSELTVKVGGGFGCVLDPGQGVYCWGDNSAGQLGQTPPKYGVVEAVRHSDVGVFIEGTEDALSLSLGASHACVLTPTDVLCWGGDDAGQIGVSVAPDTCERFVSDSGSTEVACQPIATSLGLGHQTWLSAGGEATCVGDEVASTCLGSARYRLSAMSNLTSIGISADSLCGLDSSGKLKCDGRPSASDYGVVQTLGPIESFVLGGGSNICVIGVGGALQCWGDSNSLGELGAGHTNIVDPWTTTTPVKSAVQIAAGVSHFCALSSQGAVHCWGRTVEGQVGIPPILITGGIEMTDPESYELPAGTCPGGPCEPKPVLVEGIGVATNIAAGGESTCAVTDARQVKCWGQVVGTSVPTLVAGPWSQ